MSTLNTLTIREQMDACEALRTFAPEHVMRWNTNRLYTQHGQRIGACETPYGVAFYDYDRCISGLIPGLETPNALQVMHAYDRNIFHPCIPYQLEAHLSPLA
jgi:hypothetical protein